MVTVAGEPDHGDERVLTLPSSARVPAPRPAPTPQQVEWPTLVVIGSCYALIGLVIVNGNRLPLPLTLLALALLGAWYGSIQHEAVHGHPTPWPVVNLVLTQAPLGLIYPFWLYRDHHLVHHRDEHLTHPHLDPESRYETVSRWCDGSAPYRAMRLFCQTLVGRVILGPLLSIITVGRDAIRRLRDGDHRIGVARWLVAVTVILAVVDRLGTSYWVFALGFGYLGMSVTLIRSFAEHRAVEDGVRSAVVRSRWFWGLLFLSVNLHVTHHRHPSAPWYEVRRLHRDSDAEAAARNGAGLYSGYPSLIRRFAFVPIDRVRHPTVWK